MSGAFPHGVKRQAEHPSVKRTEAVLAAEINQVGFWHLLTISTTLPTGSPIPVEGEGDHVCILHLFSTRIEILTFVFHPAKYSSLNTLDFGQPPDLLSA